MLQAHLKEEIAKLAQESIHISHFQIFLFGSQVTGEAHERSDFDVGVVASEKIPPAQLHEFRFRLNESIPLMNTFEVVDFNRVSDDFRQLALKHIQVIHEQ